MPSVFGPQWHETVQPACVSSTVSNDPYCAASSFAAATTFASAAAWVMNASSGAMSSRRQGALLHTGGCTFQTSRGTSCTRPSCRFAPRCRASGAEDSRPARPQPSSGRPFACSRGTRSKARLDLRRERAHALGDLRAGKALARRASPPRQPEGPGRCSNSPNRPQRRSRTPAPRRRHSDSSRRNSRRW